MRCELLLECYSPEHMIQALIIVLIQTIFTTCQESFNPKSVKCRLQNVDKCLRQRNLHWLMGSLASGQNTVVTAPRTHPLGAVFMARVFMRSSYNITYYSYIIGLFYCPLKYTYSSRTEYLCHIVIDYLNFPKIVQCVVIKVLKFHVLNVQGEGYSGFQVTRMVE